MILRNNFTWAYYKNEINYVALLGLDNEVKNFTEKNEELKDSEIYDIVKRLDTYIKKHKEETAEDCKSVYKKIINSLVSINIIWAVWFC